MNPAGTVDLHVHTTASDGRATPAEVVEQAVRVGLEAVAITDHDTVAGISPAIEAAAGHEVRIVAGCEFSVQAWWGELHLLGYYLPTDDKELRAFLDEQRSLRAERAVSIVRRLETLGVPVTMEEVRSCSRGAPIARPHIARALVNAGKASSVNEAFQLFLGDERPAYCPRPLPALEDVVQLVSRLGGVTSAAHLKARAGAATLRRLASIGVDAVEVLHPAHNSDVTANIRALAGRFDLLMSGGSDWHGDIVGDRHRRLGAMGVPLEWLKRLEALHRSRVTP